MYTYEDMLRDEAALWGSVDTQHAATTPPDWRAHRRLRHNAINHTADIDALLSRVTPGTRVLELGCASGWLTLACAQRGAHAVGLDVSARSLEIARAYYERVADETPGSVGYALMDLNRLALAPNAYDIIITKGTLHHLIEMQAVIEQVHRALKPGGLLWISDQDGDEALLTTLIAGGLALLLPTEVGYREKLAGLMRFGLDAPSRVKASMEAEGLSPFEGAGRDHDWAALVRARFEVELETRKPAVTGYIAHQLALPDAAALPLLRGLRAVDGVLVRAGLLHSTGLILAARKR